MKKITEIFEVTDIETKYILLSDESKQEIKVPKYKLPLETSIGMKLILNEFGMYQILDNSTFPTDIAENSLNV